MSAPNSGLPDHKIPAAPGGVAESRRQQSKTTPLSRSKTVAGNLFLTSELAEEGAQPLARCRTRQGSHRPLEEQNVLIGKKILKYTIILVVLAALTLIVSGRFVRLSSRKRRLSSHRRHRRSCFGSFFSGDSLLMLRLVPILYSLDVRPLRRFIFRTDNERAALVPSPMPTPRRISAGSCPSHSSESSALESLGALRMRQ
jgi:hypothetical protein